MSRNWPSRVRCWRERGFGRSSSERGLCGRDVGVGTEYEDAEEQDAEEGVLVVETFEGDDRAELGGAAA